MSLDGRARQATNPSRLSLLPPDMDALVPSKDAPAYLGLAEQTLARWRSEGHGPPYVKLGKKVYYRVADLRRWIEGQCVTPGPR